MEDKVEEISVKVKQKETSKMGNRREKTLQERKQTGEKKQEKKSINEIIGIPRE